jgi:cysteine desulfurase
MALGIAPHEALGSVRLSLGRHTCASDIEIAASQLVAAWRALASADASIASASNRNFATASRELST